MIAIAFILALGAALIAGLLVYWQKIVAWIKKASEKIKEVLGRAAEGTKTFIAKTSEGLKNKSKYYLRNQTTREWEEVVYMKPVNENDVPPEILAKLQRANFEEDVSTTEELSLAIGA